MAALDFPSSPTVGQQYAAPNGVTYQWDGAAWVVTGGVPAAPTGPATGDLSGSYPSPVVAKSSALPFVVPGNTTAGAAVQLGPTTGTARTRLMHHFSVPQAMVTVNRNWLSGNAPDDATLTGWGVRVATDATDNLVIQRSPIGSSSPAQLLEVRGSDGKTYCTLADASVTKTMLAVRAACNNSIQAGVPGVSPPTTTAAWVKIFDIGTITSRGGIILIFWFWNYAYVGNNSQNTVYVGFGRNGSAPATGQYVRNDFAASGSALSRWPLLTPLFMEGPAAGSYTYSVYTYVANTNGSINCPANDAPGVATVMELS